MLVVSVTSVGSCGSKDGGDDTDLAGVSWSCAYAPSGAVCRSAPARGKKTTGTIGIVLRVTAIGTASADYDRISWCRLLHAIVFLPSVTLRMFSKRVS